MEGEGVPAPAISAVLDDDDLLSEILLRVAFPTSLVQVALVCKRWLRLASAPVFLRHFHDLHPPRLLGFYILTKSSKIPRFVPIPQPPELATVIRRARFDLDTLGFRCTYVRCCNGFLVLTSHLQIGSPEQPKWIVHCPLDPAGDMSILRPVQETSMHDGFTYYDIDEILPNSGSEDMFFFHLALGSNGKQTRMDVFLLKDDIWAIYSSVVTDIPKIKLLFPSLIGHGKIYNTADCVGMLDSKLFLLDLVTSSLSLLNLPEEMDLLRSTDLSLTHDAGLHLIHVKGYQLRIWLHRMDNNGGSNWSLEGTVCLREICANSMIPTCKFKDVNGSFFTVYAVGTNSEFVFLGMEDVLYLFDIKSKAAKKVYEVKPEDQRLSYVTPIMMAWPPKFRVMN